MTELELSAYEIGKNPVFCRCGFRGFRNNLIPNRDIDRFNPRNKGLFISDPDYTKKAYWTFYELCPGCKRVIYADGREVLLLSEKEYIEKNLFEKRVWRDSQ